MRTVVSTACAVLGLGLAAAGAAAAEGVGAFLLDAKPVLDVRYRFEFVDQKGRPEDAKANTVRTRFGLETGRVAGLWAGVDAEWIEAVGGAFNDTVNGRTDVPVVADPDDLQLNQAFIASQGTIPGLDVKLGRQRIVWDNARFIGNVGFRQNEQTFDALRLNASPIRNVEIGYSYLEEVHRVFGTESPVGRLDLDGHAVRVRYRGLAAATVTPFALLLDFDRDSQDANSSATVGVTVSGRQPLAGPWTLHYAAAAARQTDYGGNPADFGLWYYAAEPGLSFGGVTGRVGIEVLEGDGESAVQTPLATLHKFNGLTDQFLVTPGDGLRDLYAGLKLEPADWLAGVAVEGAYHGFWAEDGGAHYGSEWNLGAFKAVETDYGTVVLGVQYADYDADAFAGDIRKLWLTVQFRIAPKPVRGYLGGG